MAKIGYFSDQVIYGGGESNLIRLAKSAAAHHDVTIVAPEGALIDAARTAGVNTVSIKSGRSRWVKGIPLCVNRNRSLIGSFDIAHAYSLHILPMLLGHPKLFWTTHGPWEKPWGMRAKIISIYAKKVIAVSNDVARFCRFDEEKLSTVPLGAVASDECLVMDGSIQSLAGLAVINVGVLGRLQRVKGQDIAISATARAAQADPQRKYRLHLGGALDQNRPEDVEFGREIEALASKCGHISNLEIIWHGFVQEPVAFIDAMDAIFVSSRYESFSMVLVEALSRGKPVVAPRIGGPAEILDSPALGVTFEAGSVESAVSALQQAVSEFEYSPARQVERARFFSIEAQRDSLFRLYGFGAIPDNGPAGLAAGCAGCGAATK